MKELSTTFIDREDELSFLSRSYQEDRSQLVVIYGEMLFGKTALVKEFPKDRPHIYFLADKALDRDFHDRLKQPQYMSIRYSLVEQNHELLVFCGSKIVLQIRRYNPLISLFHFIPDLARNATFADLPRRYPKLASSNTGSKIGSSLFSSAC